MFQPFEKPSPSPWSKPQGVSSVVSLWDAQSGASSRWVWSHKEPAEQAVYGVWPEGVPVSLREALEGRGMHALYTHQCEAFASVMQGVDTLIATPTASGKSICYHLPVLSTLLHNPSARALYLFPTKALARDQEASLTALMGEAGMPQTAITYDGDTPGDIRRAAREKGRVVITNPDMLHTGILPHHAQWSRFFADLKYIVVDELHTYRGVWGSHVCNVLRRVQRIASFYGAKPVYVGASATLGNPGEHAERMFERKVHVVSEAGAPKGEKHWYVYNPPWVNIDMGVKASYIKHTAYVALELLKAGVTTLVFAHTRNNVEVLHKYIKESMHSHGLNPASVVGYRGGYLPGVRRQIENDLRNGVLKCVVATHALELGIDIGSLDAVVCAGYPGSVAGLKQRFGRAGRRQEPSVCVWVASASPLDQYVASCAQDVLMGNIESARIDANNMEIAVQHLKCAAFELPFASGDTLGGMGADDVQGGLDYLHHHGVLHAVPHGAGRMYHWTADMYPANHVSLRQVGWDNVVIIDLASQDVLAEIDWRSAHTMLHTQAVYQHLAETYEVQKLDLEQRKAYVKKVECDYYTDAMVYTKVSITSVDHTEEIAGVLTVGVGDVSVVEKVVGYKKITYYTHDNVGYGEISLPDMEMHTQALWYAFKQGYLRSLNMPWPEVLDTLRGLLHVLRAVASVGLMVELRDMGVALLGEDPGDVLLEPTLVLYDAVPGGVGLSTRIFVQWRALLERAKMFVQACACVDGCPACMGPVQDMHGVGLPVRKQRLFEVLLFLQRSEYVA